MFTTARSDTARTVLVDIIHNIIIRNLKPTNILAQIDQFKNYLLPGIKEFKENEMILEIPAAACASKFKLIVNFL